MRSGLKHFFFETPAAQGRGAGLGCEACGNHRIGLSLPHRRRAASVRGPAREGARESFAEDRHPAGPVPRRVPGEREQIFAGVGGEAASADRCPSGAKRNQ